ncbi:MAG TPA: MarR family transcriptional regulator [Stellaceae bacterium]|nr:MarR family transcriptional regulator [Stellaceae bacterium]
MTNSAGRTGRRQRRGAADGEPLRLGPLADFIGFHLRLAQEASFQAFARRVRDYQMRPGRFAVLALIGENPGISQTALGRAAGRDKSTLTPALNDLVRRALVKRRRVASDRRSYALSLTAKGRRLLDELTLHARAHDRVLDEIVGLKHKAEFIRTLRRLTLV